MKKKKRKFREVCRGIPPGNFESRDKNLSNLRHSGGKFEEINYTKIHDEYQFCTFNLSTLMGCLKKNKNVSLLMFFFAHGKISFCDFLFSFP